MSRQAALAALRENPAVSVLIIGGGVNGIGTFRDLALQGVNVLLVEKGDFCSAASSGNSHMIHGGIRYLENGEFRLVKEALRERNLLLQNAPQHVFPQPTTIPIFHWTSGIGNAALRFVRLSSKPTNRGAFIIKVGLMMYDLFTRGQQGLPQHQFFSRKTSLAKRPKLNSRIVATAQYYDAWMPTPERLCVEMLLDAEAASPEARALNYVRAESAAEDTVTLRDELTGETYSVQPQVVVNATGAWIDFTNRALGRPTQLIGGTKGAHLVVDNPELLEAAGSGEMFFENKDGRIVLFFPVEDRILMGTTDIPVDNPDDARVSEKEVDYILTSVRHVFPDVRVRREDVVFWFTGVRPLPHSDAASAGQISRDHSIEVTEAGRGLAFPILSLVGGKWTTFRAFSEQTADRVLERLGHLRRLSTEHVAIGGGKNYPQNEVERGNWVRALAAELRLPQERVKTLFERYGTRAAEIAAQIVAAGDDAPFIHAPTYSRQEAQFIAQSEKVAHVDDLLLRRSSLALLGRVNGGLLAELGHALAETLHWSPDDVRDEIERAAAILREQHGVPAEKLGASTFA